MAGGLVAEGVVVQQQAQGVGVPEHGILQGVVAGDGAAAALRIVMDQRVGRRVDGRGPAVVQGHEGTSSVERGFRAKSEFTVAP